MKFKRTAMVLAAAGALAIPFAGTSVAQDAPEDLIAECQSGPIPDTVENPNYDPVEEIPNPLFEGEDAPEFIDDENTADGEVNDPETEVDETVTDPNPAFGQPEFIPNPTFDPNETIPNLEYENRLDPSGNGIACDIEDIAIWEDLLEPAPTTEPEPTEEPTTTPVPTETETETTEVPAPQQTQSQSQTVVVAPPGPAAGPTNQQGTVTRNPATRVPVQAIPSGPISR